MLVQQGGPRWTAHLGLALALAVVGLLALPAAGWTAAGSDDLFSPTHIGLFSFHQTDTETATTQAGEPLTTQTGNVGCDLDDTPAAGAAQMGNTVWYSIDGTGGPITINSFDSDFDTLIAIYRFSDQGLETCNDQAAGPNGTLLSVRSRVTFDSDASDTYAIQVGGYDEPGSVPPEFGIADIIAYEPSDAPANDNRASATSLEVGSPRVSDNVASTEQSGEDLTCNSGSGAAPLLSTVWYRYTASAEGRVTFSSTGFDTVLQAYRGNDTAPVACNDDGVPDQVGPSRTTVDVNAGETIFIQVAGFMGYQEQFTLTAEFAQIDDDGDGSTRPADCNDSRPDIRPGAPDPLSDPTDSNCDGHPGNADDKDEDGSAVSQDCDDNNAGIRPGATDVPENGVDEDCSGADAVRLDRDGDGYNAPQDCDDNNPAIRPNATDVPGNGADENCDGRDARLTLTTGGFNWLVASDGVTITRLRVRATRGMRITVTCRGSGCFRRIGVTARRRGTVDLLGRIPKSRRKVRSGTVVRILITEPNKIGKRLTLRLRRNKRTSARQICTAPRTNRAVRCP